MSRPLALALLLAPGGAQLEDEASELRAADRIGQRFGEATHVNVTSFNRVVLLDVRSVANELEIAGVSSLTARTNDSLITSNVKLRFLDAKLARTTGGVCKVVKVFEYCRPTDGACRPPAPPAAPRAHAGG